MSAERWRIWRHRIGIALVALSAAQLAAHGWLPEPARLALSLAVLTCAAALLLDGAIDLRRLRRQRRQWVAEHEAMRRRLGIRDAP